MSLMPLKLSNGSEITSFETSCNDCKVPIMQGDMRGEIEISVLGAKLKIVSRCGLCRKFSFMSGHILIEGKGWFFAFPPPGTPMTNPWTGEIIPLGKKTS